MDMTLSKLGQNNLTDELKVAKLMKIFKRVSLVKLLNLLLQCLELQSLSGCLSIDVNWLGTDS